MKIMKSRSGFTLLELLMVVVIIGVLAALAIPQYQGFVERSRAAEALNVIGAIKNAEEVYRMQSSTGFYTDSLTDLGITPSELYWRYTINYIQGLSMDIHAHRTALSAPAANVGQEIVLHYESDGTSSWAGWHPGKPKT